METGVSESAMTALRTRYARALWLSLDQQTRECIDYLQNPEVLVAEFSDSYLMAEAMEHHEEDFPSAEELPAPRRSQVDSAVKRMIAAPALKLVARERHEHESFSYVARDIVPFWKRPTENPGESEGLDYVGLTGSSPATPILGVVNPEDAEAPFVALLRLLTCLAEVGTEAQRERANRYVFKGALPEAAPFDLHLLRVGEPRGEQPAPLQQLTHDLAAVFVERLREEWALPDLVRHIVCLQIPAGDQPFDGILTEEWRV